MSQLGQSPELGQNGNFLNKQSTGGQRVDFTYQTTSAIALLTLNAAGDASNLDFGSFRVEFAYTENGNVFPWRSVLAWNYSNFYIDDGGSQSPDDRKLWRLGSDVSGATGALRKPMLVDIDHVAFYLPVISSSNINASHADFFSLQNSDSSSHTVRIITLNKYIVTGGMT